jgi:hypothetical protein
LKESVQTADTAIKRKSLYQKRAGPHTGLEEAEYPPAEALPVEGGSAASAAVLPEEAEPVEAGNVTFNREQDMI